MPDALAALHVVNSYVRGASAALDDRAPRAEELRASGRAASYPLLLGLLEGAARQEAPGAADDLFAAGLSHVVDGIAANVLDGGPPADAGDG